MIQECASCYLSELKNAIDAIPLDRFEEIVKVMLAAYDGGHSVFLMGNGGSASTSSHATCDINKGVSAGLEKRFKVRCLNDNIPTMLAYGNDNSYEDIFIEPLKNFLEPDDVVICISASGNSKNVLKAIRYANEKGAVTVAFAGFDGGQLAKLANISLTVSLNDMQKVEDIHLILMHMIMQVLYRELR